MAKTAFIGFGEVNTPVEIIVNKCKKAVEELKNEGLDLIEIYPIADNYDDSGVKKALDMLKGQDFDSLILCVAGWIPAHAVVKITEQYRHLPMVLWGLCGWIEDGRIITTADQAGTSGLRKTFKDLGYKFKYVYETIGAPSRAAKVASFAKAASAYRALRSAKVGMAGYRDMNLYGTLYDGSSLKKVIGPEIETFEMLDIQQRYEKITAEEKNAVIENVMLKNWKFLKPAKRASMEMAAGYYLAVKQIIDERNYAAISLKDVDGMKKLCGFPPAPIFMLLADLENVSTVPENDSLGNVTQLMVKFLTGQCGAYLEFYEFFENSVIAGVPDYIPAEVTMGDTTVIPAAFGELNEGILNVSKVKTGVVTMCRLFYENGKYAMHMVLGEGKTPPKWEEAGWTQPAPQLPALEVFLDDVDAFAQNVMCQHYIISYGDNREQIKDLCNILGIEVI